MLQHRLDWAKRYLDDARSLCEQQRFNSAVSRAYYASYQAMWAALGEPQEGKIWRHLAIIKHFVRGYWFAPEHAHTGPGLLEEKRFALRQLYAYRVQSDYDVIELHEQTVQPLLDVVESIIEFIEKQGGQA